MSWSFNENQRFEQAMAAIEADTPEFWQLVTQAVGGGRTASDALQHFLELHGDIHDMGATDRTIRRRHQYLRNAVQQHQHQHQHGADANANANANATATNNSRRSGRRSNGGEGSSSYSNNNNNSRGSNNRANRPQE